MLHLLRLKMRDESGATAIEYALIAGFIAVAMLSALTVASGDIVALYASIANALP